MMMMMILLFLQFSFGKRPIFFVEYFCIYSSCSPSYIEFLFNQSPVTSMWIVDS